MADVRNACAGPFGAVYDFYIEREWLSRPIGRLVWGIGLSGFYASFEAIGRVGQGGTILDVPCGGGVALRGLDPAQDVRYVAADLSEAMLVRARRRAVGRGLRQVETVAADMCALPFADESAELCLSYSGLHTVPDPELATKEIVRCLKPGGELVGTTFLSEGSRRQRRLMAAAGRRGHPIPTFTARDLRRWLTEAGIADPSVEPGRGFAVFRGYRSSAQIAVV